MVRLLSVTTAVLLGVGIELMDGVEDVEEFVVDVLELDLGQHLSLLESIVFSDKTYDVDEKEDVEGPEELRVGLVRDTKEGRDEDSDDCGGKKVLATPPMTVPRPKGLVFALEGV